MFGRISEFFFGSEHRFIRDYLLLSSFILVTATSLGVYLSRSSLTADPMSVGSIEAQANKPKNGIHYQVRSVLDPELRTNRIDTVPGEPAADVIVTGGIASALRSTRIDPCTGAQMP